MKRVKILHCADIHIGMSESFLGEKADSRRLETLLTFERIIDLAKAEGVQLIALAGDIFDSNSVEERFAKAVFDKIATIPEIKVVYAAGNHDPLNSQSPFLREELPSNLFVLPTKDYCFTFEDLSLKVYGRSFEAASIKGEEEFLLKTDGDYINLLVQHGELKSDLNSDYNAITPKFVGSCNMDYIALGHTHKKTEIGRLNNTYFAYCGCPEGQGFDETDEKGVYIGEIGKGFCDLQFVATSKRKHLCEEFNVTGLTDEGEIAADILKCLEGGDTISFRDNLYKITLTGEVNPDNEPSVEEITARLSQELYFVKVKNATEYSLDLEVLAEESSLRGIFVKNILNKINQSEGEECEINKKALRLGLKAFKGDIKWQAE